MGISTFTFDPLAGRRPSQQTAVITSRQTAEVAIAGFLSEVSFSDLLCIERKRSERSRKPFVLMLARTKDGHSTADELPALAPAIISSTRDIDITGWYAESAVIGTIFTEVGDLQNGSFEKFRDRVSKAVSERLPDPYKENIQLQFFRFPEQWNGDRPGHGNTEHLYPEVAEEHESRRLSLVIKRVIDLVGSLVALAVFTPLFALIALAVKLTSPGPVFFRQKRIGQFGKSFSFLKFRTMRADNDHKIHQDYVEKLIRGEVAKDARGQVFKITADPRVTKVGRLLRKTSLDELPQFINVLTGEMSLVGPRPPIPYELDAYDLWHRRRVLEAKPGITGLWQVHGRSRTTFDEMVRLDLQYARTWSLWLDFKILLATPRAVLSGTGAY